MSKHNHKNPVLRRDLDFTPVRDEQGDTMILLRDPFGLDKRGPLAFSEGALPLLAMLDGSNSAEDIRGQLVGRDENSAGTVKIPLEAIQSFIDSLDEAFLLENSRFFQEKNQLVESFKRQPERASTLAGVSYPEDEPGCREHLEAILRSGDGAEVAESMDEKDIVAIVAPHIELKVGEKIYSSAYGALRGRSYDRVIVLGVGHNLAEGLFSVTDKNFLTPLGSVPSDRFAVSRFRQAAEGLVAPDDFDHRNEHSIEFQVVMLQSVLEGPFTLVPILCGSLFEQLVLNDTPRPSGLKVLAPALECLRAMLNEKGSRTLIVAGVDFCHIGPKFGDRKPAIQIAGEAKKHDVVLLEHLTAMDVESFVAESRRVRDRYHVCGFSTLSLLLEILPDGIESRQLGHHIWHEAPTQSAVSFAAAAFFRK